MGLQGQANKNRPRVPSGSCELTSLPPCLQPHHMAITARPSTC